MWLWVVAFALVVGACGGKESKADDERARAAAACRKGDGPKCQLATVGLDYTKQDELRRAIELWTRGCELDHATSCAQLGTVAEFGMASGGAQADPATAAMYYARACKLGDQKSCKQVGLPGQPEAKAPFPWREALTPVCGKQRAELGPLFAGLVLGQPMPAAMQQAITAFEKQFKAHVHYYAGDPLTLTSWSLDVRFDEQEGLYPVLVAGWGKPDLPFGAWWSESAQLIAYGGDNERGSHLSWSPYRSIAQVIAPDDKAKLGFEPFPVVGAKLTALEAALGRRMLRSAEHEYRWNEVAPGPGFEVRVTEQRGVITELRTVNWITNSSEVGDALFAALETKWGKPAVDKHGTHTWRLAGRRVRASKPAMGNFEIVIDRR